MAYGRMLGISLGTRKLGIAVMEPYSIFDCAVKTFPGVWSAKKQRAILAVIERYIVKYRIEWMAIKLPALPVPAPAVTELLEGIERLAAAYEIGLRACTLSELKAALVPDTRMNKKEFIQRIVERFPELRHEYEREVKSKVRHYEKMFEAVEAGRNIL